MKKIVENQKYTFRLITPSVSKGVLTVLDDCKNSIFLAGPCPRKNYDTDDWRLEAFKILNDLKFDGTVLSPTNKYYDESDKDYLYKQTQWEYEAMHKASAIVFWIDRSEEHPAYTTNIEFGNWIGKKGVFYGWPDTAIKNNYLDVRLKMDNEKKYSDLHDMLSAVVKDLNRPAQKWFTSDTHFSQQRTLELSKRPFINLFEMDLEMISNWNKNVRKNDTVYFLGDFGTSFDYIKLLNFNTLNFVLGNYERKTPEEKEENIKKLKELQKSFDVNIFERNECQVNLSDGKLVTCAHEPINPDGRDEKHDWYLYGHIHGRTLYKSNGTDCATDTHYYTPISEEEIIWRLNAIQYLDENVWKMTCN